MSNVYNLEPPTKGKVILKTSLGDLEVELWPKEAPKACRNFVQLCLEGYYDNTIFHRIIKEYLVQGGDPSGTGEGSESIYGELFKDEFHSRLKFTHRGLVACANQNQPNTNGSQFFITLDQTDWLDKKNTIFGKVVGDTVYNLLRIGECGTDENDRPLDPPVLREVEVVWNPFDDIVPRRDARQEREEAKRHEQAAAAAAAKRTAKKNLGLLSFGEEAEEEEQHLEVAVRSSKIRSAHDALDDRRLAKSEETPAEQRIVAELTGRPAKRSKEEEQQAARALDHTKAALANRAGPAGAAAPRAGPGVSRGKEDEQEEEEEEGLEGGHRSSGVAGGSGTAGRFGSAMHDKMLEKRRQMGDVPVPRQRREEPEEADPGPSRRAPAAGDDGEEDDEEESDGDGERRRPKDFRTERNERIEEMRMETKRKGIGRMGAREEVENADLLKPWQLAREQYKQRKRLTGDREKATMARLNQFSQALKAKSSKAAADAQAASADEARQPEDAAPGEEGYSGKVRTDIDHKAYLPAAWRVDDYLDRDDLEASLEDLRTHRLQFTKESGRVDDMTRNISNTDDYVVFDPLLEKNKGKFSKAEQAKKKRQSEWSGRANQ